MPTGLTTSVSGGKTGSSRPTTKMTRLTVRPEGANYQ